jgi:phosphoribosylaminoimidazole-succinocarboxamide synthase
MRKKLEQLYEGKAKKVFKTDDDNIYIVSYKDDATAGNGAKKGTIAGKGLINNRITNHLMRLLEKNGVPTHYIEELNDTDTAVRGVSIVPLEVIVRNIAAGSLAKRLGLSEGVKLKSTVLEYCYKDDALGDPIVNEYHIAAMGWAAPEELKIIAAYSFKINNILTDYLRDAGIELIDFKLEFGRTPDGKIILADEISPDTCRLWDVKTGEKLDKDRFRRDMGGVEDAYNEVMKRLLGGVGSRE